MSSLFGSSSSASTTLGDLKQDIAIGNPPEDSISDLSFNPNPADQKDFLAVASWDKKVRIYEILSNGQAEPRHLYEHDTPVFGCDFSKVRELSRLCRSRLLGLTPGFRLRMAKKSSPAAPTSRPRSATSKRCRRCRWRNTTSPYGACASSR